MLPAVFNLSGICTALASQLVELIEVASCWTKSTQLPVRNPFVMGTPTHCTSGGHPLVIGKRFSGYAKVAYRGSMKNAHRFHVLFASTNCSPPLE